MSVPLKYGEVHPRTLLAELRSRPHADGLDRFEAELAWREFYADVLWHSPSSAWRDWREGMAALQYDHDAELIEAWQQGRTGYPFVDAGMRQLLSEGWMHNRLRMVTASFLVKDLHVWWPHGARFFLDRLIDGDVASNSHGWQWVAGTGTDAAPYFRIFNPVSQGLRFDPDGDFVRRWIPELRHLPGSAAHEPWRHPDGYRGGYVSRVIDHDAERREALARWAEARGAA
jgi:deoxyribodipyrimidine photo-lyase